MSRWETGEDGAWRRGGGKAPHVKEIGPRHDIGKCTNVRVAPGGKENAEILIHVRVKLGPVRGECAGVFLGVQVGRRGYQAKTGHHRSTRSRSMTIAEQSVREHQDSDRCRYPKKMALSRLKRALEWRRRRRPLEVTPVFWTGS